MEYIFKKLILVVRAQTYFFQIAIFCVTRIREPKVSFGFVFFDKLKHEIRNKVLILVSILKFEHKTK